MHLENEKTEKMKFYLLKQYNYRSNFHFFNIVLLIFIQKEMKITI